jgi:hypothetical protein
MNNWNEEEIQFRCERLSIRLERLAQNFMKMASLSLDTANAEDVFVIIRQNKVFLELTAIDLDIDSAFELAQMQRQLSQWHIQWTEIWTSDSDRLEISMLARTWSTRIQEMAGVLV